jgi:hypothetical protein
MAIPGIARVNIRVQRIDGSAVTLSLSSAGWHIVVGQRRDYIIGDGVAHTFSKEDPDSSKEDPDSFDDLMRDVYGEDMPDPEGDWPFRVADHPGVHGRERCGNQGRPDADGETVAMKQRTRTLAA